MIRIFTCLMLNFSTPCFRPEAKLPGTFRQLIFWAVAAFFGATALSPVETALAQGTSRQILIIYSGNTLGELKPCGCAREEDQGGIERRMSHLKEVRARAKNTLFVDTGDNFKEPTRQGKLKGQTLMAAMAKMEYDAVTLGDHDFVYGNPFIREQKDIPWVLSNIAIDGMPIPDVRIKRFSNGLKAAVIAVADPDLLYGIQHSKSRVMTPEKAVRSLVQSLKASENPDLVVLLTHMEKEKALPFLDLDGVDVVINGHIKTDTDTPDMTPVKKGNKIFVQPGPRGQKMGELEITIDSAGGKSFAQRMVPLGSKVPADAEMTKLYEKYNTEVEEIFFASLKKRRSSPDKKVFATETICKTCHVETHETWANSRHGHAYDTLRKVNKAFDPECLVCHVTGLNQPGGFISEIDTPDLKNVQCEVCHGPALNHTQAPAKGFGKDARQACKRCHVKNHSPGFNFATYWDKIKH